MINIFSNAVPRLEAGEKLNFIDSMSIVEGLKSSKNFGAKQALRRIERATQPPRSKKKGMNLLQFAQSFGGVQVIHESRPEDTEGPPLSG